MDCSICCEKFNKSNHLYIDCKSCTDDAAPVCRTCAQTFILSSSDDPSCIICKNIWERPFMDKYLSKTFTNTKYKSHRETILMDRQIALLPATQPFAAIQKKVFNTDKQINLAELELFKLNTLVSKQKKLIRELINIRYTIRNGNETNHTNTNNVFTFKCPIPLCKGFLDNKNVCGLCTSKICKHCMEIKLDNHTCDDDKKKSVALIKKDTKPCPSCGEMIFKISGCDQMYCITCNTAFSWNTGTIETGNIHNPEYYRWIRDNGDVVPRNPLDIPNDPCAIVIPTYNNILTFFRTIWPVHKNYDNIFTYRACNIHRMYFHIQQKIRDNDNELILYDNELRNLRISFLLDIINKDAWKHKLQIIEKKHKKETDFINIWKLISMVIHNILSQILNDNNPTSIINLLKPTDNLSDFANDSFKNVGELYNNVYPGIDSKFIEITNYKKYNST